MANNTPQLPIFFRTGVENAARHNAGIRVETGPSGTTFHLGFINFPPLIFAGLIMSGRKK